MRAREAIDWAAGELGQYNIESAKQESETLLSTLFDCSRLNLYLDNRPLEAEELSWIKKRIRERKEGRPLQYLLGAAYFMGLQFEVNPDVLIPRPETEILVEAAIEKLKKKEQTLPALIIDLGTGSGNIAIAIAKLYPHCRVLGLDISLAALKVARRNALKHKVDKRIDFVLGNGFSSLKICPALSCPEENRETRRSWASADMIVSNPPYIKSADLTQPRSFGSGFGRLPREIGFEPRVALDGGEDGLKYYRRIIRKSPTYLKEGGYLIMEIGDTQANDVSKMLSASGKFREIKTAKDYNNIERVITAKKISNHKSTRMDKPADISRKAAKNAKSAKPPFRERQGKLN